MRLAIHEARVSSELMEESPLHHGRAEVMNLDGKVALITGATSDIGHAIAKRYLEADGTVVITDLNANGAKAGEPTAYR